MRSNSMRVAALLAAFSVLLAVVACSDEEVATPSQTDVVATTPAPSVPTDWATYTDPQGLFTVRYPADWYRDGAAFWNSDPRTWIGPAVPPEVIKVEISIHPDDGYGCGVLNYDLASGLVSPEDGATSASLDGVSAWQIVRAPGDPRLNDPNTRIEAISAIYNDYCFNLAAYFTQKAPDSATFGHIVASLRFSR